MTAMVTGASSGIGRATALALARMGFGVVAAGRSAQRTGTLVEAIRGEGNHAEYLHLDLASLASARRAAMTFEQSGRQLDVLVDNAGVGVARGLTEDGFEIHFGVNHLGHFMLTHHLRRTFRPGTRIVVVSSSAHHRVTGIDFDDVRRRTRSLFGLKEYAVSKLANVLFARELAKRQPDVRIYAVHPGFANTGIIPPLAKPFLRGSLITADAGADTVVWCATAPEIADQSGLYYLDRRVGHPSTAAQDDDLADELWRHSERWCGVAPVH